MDEGSGYFRVLLYVSGSPILPTERMGSQHRKNELGHESFILWKDSCVVMRADLHDVGKTKVVEKLLRRIVLLWSSELLTAFNICGSHIQEQKVMLLNTMKYHNEDNNLNSLLSF